MWSLAKRLDRLEHVFGLLREREKELDFAKLDRLSPEERREQIVQLSVRIAQRRGIVPAPGERIEDVVARALKADPRIVELFSSATKVVQRHQHV